MQQSNIGRAASLATQSELSDDLLNFTCFSKDEMETLFPAQSDKTEFNKLIEIVAKATDDNDRKTKIIGNINDIAGAVSKLLVKTCMRVV
jgi:hypothetical protein